MARNKNSTALFDVIHAAKKPPKASPSASIPTPRWWGKDRKENKKLPPNTSTASTENVGRQQSWLAAAKKNPLATPMSAVPAVVEPAVVENVAIENAWFENVPVENVPVENVPVENVPVENVAVESSAEATVSADAEIPTQPVESPRPKPRFIDRFVSRSAPATQVPTFEAVASSADPIATATWPNDNDQWTDSEFVQLKPAPRIQPDSEPAFRMDPVSKEFRFRLSYGGIVAIAFIFMMAMAIAFIAGSRTGNNETADSDKLPSTQPAPPTAGMMASIGTVKPRTADPQANLPVSLNVLNVGGHNVKPPVTLKDPAIPLTPVAPLQPLKNTRDIGMMYVVIQSYAEHNLAEKACDFVNKAGISATVVAGPSEWAPRDWYSVISLQSFVKHDPTLADFERKIKVLGTKFSSNVLNQFDDPRAYTWRQDSDLDQP